MVTNRAGRQRAVPDLRLGEDQIDLLEGLARCLRTQEVDEWNRRGAREQHP